MRMVPIAHIFFYYARGGQKRLNFPFDVSAYYYVSVRIYAYVSFIMCWIKAKKTKRRILLVQLIIFKNADFLHLGQSVRTSVQDS